MIELRANISTVPGTEAAFEALARRLAVETLRLEPGAQRSEYVRHAEPGRYQVSMVFDDHDAFIEHQASQHHVVLAGAMKEMIAEISVERVDRIVGASDGDGALPPVSEAELDERRAHYRDRYPLPAAAWWSA